MLSLLWESALSGASAEVVSNSPMPNSPKKMRQECADRKRIAAKVYFITAILEYINTSLFCLRKCSLLIDWQNLLQKSTAVCWVEQTQMGQKMPTAERLTPTPLNSKTNKSRKLPWYLLTTFTVALIRGHVSSFFSSNSFEKNRANQISMLRNFLMVVKWWRVEFWKRTLIWILLLHFFVL